MEKHPKQTTMNGAEIKNLGEVLSAEGLKNLVAEAGIDGSTPKERADQFKNVSLDDFAGLIDNINRGVQGSADSLILEDGVMLIRSGLVMWLHLVLCCFIHFRMEIAGRLEL